MTFESISTQDLTAQINNPDYAIIDIRPSAAYNGWRLQDEARGGHIHGAVSFSCSWAEGLSPPKFNSLLSAKGLTPNKTVVVYGNQRDACVAMAERLEKIGFGAIRIYTAGIQEWAADPGLPMAFLPNYKKLVHPAWIQQIISGQKPDHFPQQEYRLFEASWGGCEEYQNGHIPGAIHLDLSLTEDQLTNNIVPDEDLLKFLLGLGITSDLTVILYGRDMMPAARAASILLYAGVEDVRILDGGYDSWLKARYAVEKGQQKSTHRDEFGGTFPAHPEYIIGLNSVRALLADEQGLLVSVRSWEEYTGKTSGYSYIKAKGHIAGAVWGYSGSDALHMQDYKNPDLTMRSYPEIVANWQRQGITPDKKIAFYCGTGWRASEAFLYAHLLGWPQIAIYDGGWYEWSQDSSNAIETNFP